jgi:glycerophosphoryl diester phosphodiesterase
VILHGPGRPLVIGHRNDTREAFVDVIDAGADVVEIDVSPGLVVAHSLREARAEALSLAEALAFLAERQVAVHVDVKRPGYEQEVVAALGDHGLADRSFISSPWAASTRRFAALAPELPRALSYPRDRYGASSLRWPRAAAGAGAASLRAVMPALTGPLLRRSSASALSLHHRVCSAGVVSAAHRMGAPVIVWTVNDAAAVRRFAALGVDGIVSDDPGMALATLTAP